MSEGGRQEGRMNAVWWIFLMRLWRSFSVLDEGREGGEVEVGGWRWMYTYRGTEGYGQKKKMGGSAL